MGTLQKKDFEVPLSPLTVKGSYFNSVDEVYQAWLFFGYRQYDMSRTYGLRVPASDFTLDAIEADGQVNMTVGKKQFMNPIATSFYADWDYEGNPHYRSRAVKLRSFVASAVDMMMQDQEHERGQNDRSDFLSLQLIRWAYAYGVAKDVLPNNVRNAYENGLIRMFEKLERWGPTGVHADIDIAAVVGVLYAAQFVDSKDLTQRAHNYINRLLDKFFSDAGYIDHGSAYDAGYNGISAYFMNWAAQISNYTPLVNALKKMSKFKAYQTLPDPDGRRFSPFHSNPSSGADAPHDIWGPYYRDAGLAKYSDNAIYLALSGGNKRISSESRMLEDMNNQLRYFNRDGSPNEFVTPINKSPRIWKHSHWFDTESFDATAFYYQNGLYNRLKSFQNSNSSLTKPPYSRNEEFTESFADKYLSVKRRSYGTIIFNDRLSWWTSKGQTKKLNGFGGGNLSAFWTPETGSVLLGGSRGTHDSGHNLNEWREWPVHALSGETADGRGFSSGLQRYPEATYELNRNPERVTITGDLTNSYPDPRDGLGGQADYKRVFQIKENGVEVTTSVQADGSNRVNELYEILPVYRRNAYRQSSATPTSIEFKVNGSWQQAGTNFQQVSSIRLNRFNGQVYIDFEKPARVKLSSEDFYQNPDGKNGLQARNIMIDLLGTDGQAIELTDRSVSYFMRSSKAEPNNWNDDGSEQEKDTTPPEITELYHNHSQPDDTQQFSLNATADDAGGIAQITLYFQDEEAKTCTGTQNCSVTIGPYSGGTYSYYATATDKAGNKATSSTQEVVVQTNSNQPDENTAPDISQALLSKKSSFLQTDVENVSDPDGDEVYLNYDWRVDDKSIAFVNMSFDVKEIIENEQQIKNYSSFSNNGVAESSSQMPQWNSSGRKGPALDFDGKDDQFRIPAKGKTFEKFTIEAWVKQDGWGKDWASLVSKPFSNSSWNNPWAVFKLSRFSDKDNLNFQVTVGNNEAASIQSQQNIPQNKWTHVVGTYDGNTLKIYINGVLDSSKEFGKALADNSNTDIYIGNSANNEITSEHYKGMLDEVKVLNTALSPEQVQYHYNQNYDKISLNNTRPNQNWKVAVAANDGKTFTDPVLTNTVTTGSSNPEDTTPSEDTTPPEVAVSHTPDTPGDSQEITLSVEADDTSGISKIDLYMEGEIIKTCNNSDKCSKAVGPLQAGNYSYGALVIDTNGNVKKSGKTPLTVNTVVIDDTPPEIAVSHSPNNPDDTQEIHLSAEASDSEGIQTIEIFSGDKKIKTCNDSENCKVTLGPKEKGTYRYHARATDINGNTKTTAKKQVAVEIEPVEDATAPEIEVEHTPSKPDNSEQVGIIVDASDAGGIGQIAIYVDGQKVKTCVEADNCSVELGPYKDGNYSYYATATDNNGNKKTAPQKQFTVKTEPEDITPPEMAVSHAPEHPDESQQISFEAEASDMAGVRQIELFVDDKKVKTCSDAESCSVALGPYNKGTYRYHATATDENGNKRSTAKKQVAVQTMGSEDTTPPEINVSHTPTEPENSQQVGIIVEADDASGISEIVIFVAGEKVKTCTQSKNCSTELGPYKDGQYSYYATATDKNENSKKTTSKTFTVETTPVDTSAPEINLSHSPDNPGADQNITLKANAKDAAGVSRIELFLGDEKVQTCSDAENCSAVVGPFSDGTYSYHAVAIDNNGNKKITAKKQIAVRTNTTQEDTAAPEITVSHTPDQPDDSKKVTLVAEADDVSGIGQITLYLGEKKVNTCTDSDNCSIELGPFKEGSYAYYATSTDTKGNTATSDKGSINVVAKVKEDRKAPSIDITHSPAEPYANEIVTFKASSSDNSGIESLKIYIDDQLAKQCSDISECTFKKGSFSAEKHSYYATASDKSAKGNKATSETKMINVLEVPSTNTVPQNVSVTLKEEKDFLESTVKNVSDPDGDAVNINYDWRLNGESIAVINFPFDVQTDPQQKETVKDYASGGNDGITGTGKSNAIWTKDGKVGGGIDFDGEHDFVKVTSRKSLEQLQSFSVEAWVKHDNWGDKRASIISKPFSNKKWENPWSVFKLSRKGESDNLNFQITVGDNEALSLQSDGEIPSGEWTHIVGTYDGETLKLFLNGELDTELLIGKPLIQNTGTDIYVGQSSNIANTDTENFKGTLDELRVYNRALSVNQIQKHFSGTYNNLSLDLTKANQKWQVAVTANDSKSRSRATTSNSIITKKAEQTDKSDNSISITQNYPNPFNSSTTIDMDLEAKETMTIKIYDSLGRHIRTVFKGEMPAGPQTMEIDGRNMASGIYFCRFAMESEVVTKKMTHIK